MQRNQERAAAHAKKCAEKADAIASLKALVHKVPSAYSTWGVIQTRAWMAVNKKAAQALGSKNGPSANRAKDLVRRFMEINTADIEMLNKVAQNIKEGQDNAKMPARTVRRETRMCASF